MRILLMGPPGSGKGTQSTILSASNDVPSISTGDIFRAHVRHGTPLGRDIERVMASGGYVPDEVTNAVIEARLGEGDAAQGFILDGYPRTPSQVAELDLVLAEAGVSLDAVVHLSVPADDLLVRLTTRGARGGRSDDIPEAITARIALYEAVTAPLLDMYRERNIVIEVDGRHDPASVAADIRQGVRNLTTTPTGTAE